VTLTDSRQERAALCDTLAALGPDRPTLCAGWRTRDLAAHLYLRERRPLAGAGIALRPLAGHTARTQQRLAERPYDELIAALRRPPVWAPTRLVAVDHAMNSMEFFIHHEDARRAQPDWQPRALPPTLTAHLWSRVRAVARLRLRRFPALVIVAAEGHGDVRTGRAGEGPTEPVELRGDPGELILFLAGRQQASRVTLRGPRAHTDRLAAARLAL
jgi:uncharacterized protein (TIGR03085 family)